MLVKMEEEGCKARNPEDYWKLEKAVSKRNTSVLSLRTQFRTSRSIRQ
jgi:hypothetical protein